MCSLWTTDDIIAGTRGRSFSRWTCNSIVKDSRNVPSGSAFIALKGLRTDGHLYAREAIESGAVGCIVEKVPPGVPEEKCLIVQNTFEALHNLALYARLRSKSKVIAITGSLGKTSVKDNLTRVLRICKSNKVSASERSFNNHWGVPYTLVNHSPQNDFLVIEIGTSRRGEINQLTQIAKPNVALITTIAEMHTENLGSLKEIANEKSEIFFGMDAGGVVILNRDMAFYRHLFEKAQNHDLKVITFGWHVKSDFKVCFAKFLSSTSQRVTISAFGKKLSYTIPTAADHWSTNSAAILASAYALGVKPSATARAISSLVIPDGRGSMHQVKTSPCGKFFTIIDESYNAGPTSMRAALSVLGKMNPEHDGRRIAILGDMNELGNRSLSYHQALVYDLLNAHVDLVFTVGPKMMDLFKILPQQMRGGYSSNPIELSTQIHSIIRGGDLLLIKGSKNQYADRGWLSFLVDSFLKRN